MTTTQILEIAQNPACLRNRFIQDVVGKLQRYGSISERQMNALVAAIQRDINKPVETVGEAPNGKATVIGVVVSSKWTGGDFPRLGMTVKLENNAKVWCTVPSGIRDNELKGSKIEVTATWERSATDNSFAFGKRPKATILARPAPVVEAPPVIDQPGKVITAALEQVGPVGSEERKVATEQVFDRIDNGEALPQIAASMAPAAPTAIKDGMTLAQIIAAMAGK